MTLEKINHEVPIKDLTEIMSIFVANKTVSTWKFKEEGMKAFPQHEPFFTGLEWMLDKMIAPINLDRYFKSANSTEASTKIIANSIFLEIISKAKDCTLKKRFTSDPRIKTKLCC